MQGKNVVQLDSNIPTSMPPSYVYDLDADRLCVALMIIRDSQKLPFACHMKVFTSDRMKRLLQERAGWQIPAKGNEVGIDVDAGDTRVDCAFFDEHKIAVLYAKQELTADQFDQLDRVNNIRSSAVLRGLLIIGNPRVDVGVTVDLPSLDELLSGATRVRQTVVLANDDGEDVELNIAHHFSTPTAKQSTEFIRSSKLRSADGGARRVVTNFKEIERLYDALIQKVDGTVGEFSAAKIPFTWKLNAIQTLFREAERKNV